MRWEEKVAFLRQPRIYSDGSRRVRVIETHYAWVFLTRRHAYKLKKPLRQNEMDYRTLAARERGCRAELELNRRLAPDVYLAVVPLTVRNGELQLNGRGRVVDYLVQMRRLPAEAMLDRVLQRRALTAGECRQLIAKLETFFTSARRVPLSGERYVERTLVLVRDNERALCTADRSFEALSREVTELQRMLIGRMRKAIARRGRELIDGHGDLRAEHVHLGPPVNVIDCLEFDSELRRLDPLEDAALLILEVERLGRTRLAGQLGRSVARLVPHEVAGPLLHFYLSRRATTRAKLSAWHLGDPQFPDPKPWIARTHSYLQDAKRHARRALTLLHADGKRIRSVGSRSAASRHQPSTIAIRNAVS
ncbi:MAG TPA: hypothetical protein VIL32_13965 [Steroidobacteraceae bacterium]